MLEMLQPGSLISPAGTQLGPEQSGHTAGARPALLQRRRADDDRPAGCPSRLERSARLDRTRSDDGAALPGDLHLADGGNLRSACERCAEVTRSQGAVARLTAALVTSLLVAVRAAAEDPAAPPAGEPGEEHEASLAEINKQLTNPVSSIWSITFQQNNFWVDPGEGSGDRWAPNLLFQPVLPIGISEDWNLITRPVVPLVVCQPRPDAEPGDPGERRPLDGLRGHRPDAAGVAEPGARGKLAARARPDLDVSHGDLGLHRQRQVPGRARRAGGLPGGQGSSSAHCSRAGGPLRARTPGPTPAR